MALSLPGVQISFTSIILPSRLDARTNSVFLLLARLWVLDTHWQTPLCPASCLTPHHHPAMPSSYGNTMMLMAVDAYRIQVSVALHIHLWQGLDDDAFLHLANASVHTFSGPMH